MLSGILNRIATFAIFSQISSTGWLGFVLLSFLPFFGYTVLGWNHGIIISSFFIDRMIFVFFYFLANTYHMQKSNRSKSQSLFKDFFVFLVSSYMLLQFLALVLSLSGLLNDFKLTHELYEMSISIFVVYLIQWLLSLRTVDSNKWEGNVGTKAVLITISSAFIFMVSFFLGVFLKRPLQGTFLGAFFQTGYGVIIFCIMSFRLMFDVVSFKMNKLLNPTSSN